jgi:hypothetical protein
MAQATKAAMRDLVESPALFQGKDSSASRHLKDVTITHLDKPWGDLFLLMQVIPKRQLWQWCLPCVIKRQ